MHSPLLQPPTYCVFARTPCEMGHPSPICIRALLPPFFKAASCEVSFRRARGALRCYAQNLSSSVGHRRGFCEIRSFGEFNPARTRWRETDAAEKKKRTNRGKRGKRERTRTTCGCEHWLDRFCSDERVMDIKWTHGTHRQINSIYEVLLLLSGEILTNIWVIYAQRVRPTKNTHESLFGALSLHELFANEYRLLQTANVHTTLLRRRMIRAWN